MPRPHWILGTETHVGRGYFACRCFEFKSEALTEARDGWMLKKSEMVALRKEGRVDFALKRARELQCIALELVSCRCPTPEVHDDI